MVQQEGKVETSFYTHTKEATTANTTNPENELRTAEQTTYIWRRRKDHTEMSKEAEPLQSMTQPQSQLIEEKRNGEGRGYSPKNCAHLALEMCCGNKSSLHGLWELVGLDTRASWNTLGG